MAAPRSVAPQPNLAPLVFAVAVVVAAVAAWFRLPGALVLLFGMVVATFFTSAPPLTGKKDAAGYPTIEKYNRSTKSGLVLPKEWIYFLPEPADPFDQDGTALGATFYGQTVTSESPEFDIAPGEQPGVVVGVYREDRIPYTVEVMADAITLPVARDANRAMAVKVL